MKQLYYQYPLLVLKDNDKNIYVFDNNLGLVSEGGDKFYKDLLIIDREGEVYKFKRTNSVKFAGIPLSVRYFQKMYIVNLEVDVCGKMKLDEIKKILIKKIEKYKSHWLVLDSFEDIEKRIMSCEAVEELCDIFR